MYVCMPLCTHTTGNRETRDWLLMLFSKPSYNDTGEKITKRVVKTHPDHTYMRQCVFNGLCIKKDMQVTKSKTSWMTKEVGNMQIHLHVSWWCLVFTPFPPPPNSNCGLQFLSSDQDVPIPNYPKNECQRQIVNVNSCPVNWSFILVTDPLSKATSLPNAYCLIHSNTHLHYALASFSVPLPVQQHDLQAEPDGANRPANTYK